MHDTGQDAVDAICDLLLDENLAVNQVTSGPWTETLRPFVAHPVGMVGTDSTFVGAKPSPRTYGSFPRILGQFVRDEALLSLEEAVRKMTSAPAARLGLRERGTLRDGAIADVVVFDPATVRSTATYDEPRSYPIGIETVIVNGTLVVRRWRAHRRDAGTRDPPRKGLGLARLPAVRLAVDRLLRVDQVGASTGVPMDLGVHPLGGNPAGVQQLSSPDALAQPIASLSATAPDSSHRSQVRRTRST